MAAPFRLERKAQPDRSTRLASGLRQFAPILLLFGALSCSETVRVVSQGPTEPSTKLEELTDAVAARFTRPERSSRFEQTRRRMVSGALHPSRVFSDTSLWGAETSPTFRTITAKGALTDRGYLFDVVEHAPITTIGDTRHVITLRRLGDGEYQWGTGVDFAIGSITAADVGGMMSRLFTAGVGHDATAGRAASVAAFPRSAAVLSKLFTIDSLTTRPGPQGTIAVTLALGFHTERLAATSPHFAEYLAKYVEGSRYRFLVTDRTGAPYFEAVGAAKKLTITYRIDGDHLVSSNGPPRTMPDSLRMVSDLTVRVKMFDAGWKNLVTDFTIDRTSRSRSWRFVAHKEPDWDLPLATAHLIRSSLRRPFEGAGATLELAVIDSAGGQTILARRARLEVKESAIMRFLSSLISRVFDDLDTAVEREEAAYIRELMQAFQQDSRALFIR
jgi:hypothetical protein